MISTGPPLFERKRIPGKAVTAHLRGTGIPYTTVELNDSRGIRHRGPWQTGLLGCLLRGVVFALPGLA
jgi:hypothetical protein